MRSLITSIVAATIMAAAAPAYPHSGDRLRGEGGVEGVSEGRSPFLSIPHQDFWKGETHVIKKYLEARKGEKYGIVIRNQTPERIGVVIAVDGRNILSGKKSNLKNTEAMYIVNRYGDGHYDGWRTASDTVHTFYFTDTADSYAMRTFSDSSSMGLIAVAVFREKERPQPLYEQKSLGQAPGAPSAESSARSKAGVAKDESAGTGFGDSRYSPTIKVSFEPEGAPALKTLIKYEWHEALCRKGILTCGQGPRNRLWDQDEYAPYPPGFRRN
jgi:hypothetical protein